MKIHRISYNFKGRRRTVQLTNNRLLVIGRNGSGKSALLEAVDFALGRNTPGRPDLKDQTPAGSEMFAEIVFELDHGRMATLRRSRGWSKKGEFQKPVATLTVEGDALDADAWIAKNIAPATKGLGWLTESDAKLRPLFVALSRSPGAANAQANLDRCDAEAKTALANLKNANAVVVARQGDVSKAAKVLPTADVKAALDAAKAKQAELGQVAKAPVTHPAAALVGQHEAAVKRLGTLSDTLSRLEDEGRELSDVVRMEDGIIVAEQEVAAALKDAEGRALTSSTRASEAHHHAAAVQKLLDQINSITCCPTCSQAIGEDVRATFGDRLKAANAACDRCDETHSATVDECDELRERRDEVRGWRLTYSRHCEVFEQVHETENAMAEARRKINELEDAWKGYGLDLPVDAAKVPAEDAAAAAARRKAWEAASAEVDTARAALEAAKARDNAQVALAEAEKTAAAAQAESDKAHEAKRAAVEALEGMVAAGCSNLVKNAAKVGDLRVAYQPEFGFGLQDGDTFVPVAGCSTAQRTMLGVALDRAHLDVVDPFRDDAVNEVVAIEADPLDADHFAALLSTVGDIGPLVMVATCHRHPVPEGWTVVDMEVEA